jgi:hypothetical protein
MLHKFKLIAKLDCEEESKSILMNYEMQLIIISREKAAGRKNKQHVKRSVIIASLKGIDQLFTMVLSLLKTKR